MSLKEEEELDNTIEKIECKKPRNVYTNFCSEKREEIQKNLFKDDIKIKNSSKSPEKNKARQNVKNKEFKKINSILSQQMNH